MSTCTKRTVVADASGTTTDIQNFSGTVFTSVTISFTDASAAFNAS